MPQQIRLKRKLEQEESPEVLYLEGSGQAHVFVRVDSNNGGTSVERRHPEVDNALFQQQSHPPEVATSGGSEHNVQTLPSSSPSLTITAGKPVSDPALPSELNLQRYVLSTSKKRRGSIATFELQSDRPVKKQQLSSPKVEEVRQSLAAVQLEEGPLKKQQLSTAGSSPKVGNVRQRLASVQLEEGHGRTEDGGSDQAPQHGPATIPEKTVLARGSRTEHVVDQAPKYQRAAIVNGRRGHIFQPKANVVRDVMDVDKVDEEGNFIYDTYILQEARELDLSAANRSNVGILVIPEEDQPIWETYVDEHAESDDEVQSDDEDSNAEDYYGADYPEDEFESDDSDGIAPRRYRYRVSDEEEYGPEDEFDLYNERDSDDEDDDSYD